MNYRDFKNGLLKSTTEEMVKSIYAKYYKLVYDTSDKHDLYTPEVLYEFKYGFIRGNE